MSSTAEQILEATADLSKQVNGLSFSPPVTHVYNPLDYACAAYEQYVRRFADGPKRVVFHGMNPGPWGMAQTGVPFGEVRVVRDWLGIDAEIGKPPNEHPKRQIDGLNCPRSEVSGQRFWGLFQDHFASAGAFLEDHYVANYCPLLFIEQSGRNRTPDKLPVAERRALQAICDGHLRAVIDTLKPEHLVAVGRFAQTRATAALSEVADGHGLRITRLPHPSPASPAANRDWAGQAMAVLTSSGIW